MADLAQHNRLDLNYVWGDYPRCLRCSKAAQDWHHCFGRGGKNKRKLHSSIFGAAPICRSCHSGNINSRGKELMEKITKKIAQSGYIPSELDLEFIRTYT